MSRSSKKLRTVALDAMRVGLSFAQLHLLTGDAPVEADFSNSDDIASDEAERLLDILRSDVGHSERDLQEHLGNAPIPADRRTHTLMTGVIQKVFPHAIVAGEEATWEEWLIAEQAAPGDLIFILDAIDGSLPYDALTFGYSSNILVYERKAGDVDRLLLAATANSSGFAAFYDHKARQVLAGSLTAIQPVSPPLRADFREDAVALLASDWAHRKSVLPILCDETLTIFTTGGAPASLGLILGRMSALACSKRQATWDAVYLPILAFLGIPIVVPGATDAATVSIGLPEVLTYFGRVRHLEKADTKPVPRFVAARNPELAHRLAAMLPKDPEPNP